MENGDGSQMLIKKKKKKERALLEISQLRDKARKIERNHVITAPCGEDTGLGKFISGNSSAAISTLKSCLRGTFSDLYHTYNVQSLTETLK